MDLYTKYRLVKLIASQSKRKTTCKVFESAYLPLFTVRLFHNGKFTSCQCAVAY